LSPILSQATEKNLDISISHVVLLVVQMKRRVLPRAMHYLFIILDYIQVEEFRMWWDRWPFRRPKAYEFI